MSRLITAKDILVLKPCNRYTEEIIRANHGEKGITLDELIALDIPRKDLIWVLFNLIPEPKRSSAVIDIGKLVHQKRGVQFTSKSKERAIRCSRDMSVFIAWAVSIGQSVPVLKKYIEQSDE